MKYFISRKLLYFQKQLFQFDFYILSRLRICTLVDETYKNVIRFLLTFIERGHNGIVEALFSTLLLKLLEFDNVNKTLTK